MFETKAFKDGSPFEVKLIEEGKNGRNNKYEVRYGPMNLCSEDEDTFTNLINKGYVPVVGNIHDRSFVKKVFSDKFCAKQLASILAMQSIEMFFPATQAVRSDLILEARDKLSDHLPTFWSSMLKLSRELKPLVDSCSKPIEVLNEGRELVDTIVRPALIDLNDKIEKERKQWFYKIFGNVYRGIKLAAGNPLTTPEQLIKSSLVLGMDTAMEVVNNAKKIEAMKAEVGLTYLLELKSLVRGN